MSGPFDFSVPEEGIVGRLREQLMAPGAEIVRAVFAVPELADVPAHAQVVPAVLIVYLGHTIASPSGVADEYTATVVHRWAVAIAVANASDIRDAQPRHDEAGPLTEAAARALHGFVPAKGFTALALATPPPPYYEGKYAYLPIAVITRAIACA